eukprot:scaffold5108_cov228-Pinguiococcus_pyrenoidosus.AAC.1
MFMYRSTGLVGGELGIGRKAEVEGELRRNIDEHIPSIFLLDLLHDEQLLHRLTITPLDLIFTLACPRRRDAPLPGREKAILDVLVRG